MRHLALFLVLATLATRAGAEETCAAGGRSACLRDGKAALERGNATAALEAFSKACSANLLQGCLEEGRLSLSMGDLDGADPPLRKVQQEDRADGYFALADVYDARSNHGAAQELRWEGLAIEQPDAEFVGRYRWPLVPATTDLGAAFVVDLRIHPMAFDARRVSCGLQLVLGQGEQEVFATLGVQHFVTDWFILYADALAGGRTSGSPIDVGMQGGVELALGYVGHLDLGMGSTLGSPLHFSLGIGFDWLVALDIAVHAL